MRLKSVFAVLFLTSSFASAGAKQTLRFLYPDLPPGMLELRMQNVRDPEEFFRHFVAYFHLAAKQQVFSWPEFKEAATVNGWCAGDPHTENFGVLLSSNGRSFFLMNDKDDAGPCPLASDILRMMVSWRFVWDKFPLNEIVAAYQDGLAGRAAPEIPKYVRDLHQRAQRKGLYPDSRWIDLDKMKFRKDDELREVSSSVASTLANALGLEVLRDWKVVDVRQRTKIGGGSGGRFRYLLLLERRKGEYALIEFKEITRAATFVYGGTALPPEQRMRAALRWEAAPVMGYWDRTISVLNHPFFVRPLWDGQSDVVQKDLQHADTIPVARYEAYLIGDLHRRSTDLPRLAPRTLNVNPAAWEKATRVLMQSEIDAFNEIRREK